MPAWSTRVTARSAGALQVLPPAARAELAAQLRRCVAPGGRLVVTVALDDFMDDEDPPVWGVVAIFERPVSRPA